MSIDVGAGMRSSDIPDGREREPDVGTCSVCRARGSLKKDGTMRQHWRYGWPRRGGNPPCGGTGQKPSILNEGRVTRYLAEARHKETQHGGTMTGADTEYAYRWQLTAHRILGELLSEAQRTELPPLMWTLASTGALTGEAAGLGSTTDQQRTDVTAWARHLGATVTETPRNDGRVSLVAPFDRDGERRGVIRAELFPEDD